MIKVNDLSVTFTQYEGWWTQRRVSVLHDVSLAIHEREIVAIIGASGSGKSILAHALLGLLPENAHLSGDMRFRGEVLTDRLQRTLRGTVIHFIPQSVNFLDPLQRVGKQVQWGRSKACAIVEQRDLFHRYGLSSTVAELYPHELSGGMRRRVLFATAMHNTTQCIIADEPTPGVHPSILKAMLDDFMRLREEGVSILFITHDLMAALRVADRVYIMKDGRVVEEAQPSQFVGRGESLVHSYTKNLWRALPENEFSVEEEFHVTSE